jgi:Mce-associated membrane protein
VTSEDSTKAETDPTDSRDVEDTEDTVDTVDAQDDPRGEPEAAEPAAQQPTPVTRPQPRLKKWIGPLAAAVVLLAAASAAGWLYFFQYRVDQQTDAEAARVALDAAKDGTIALLSYAPETLDQDFATAKARLTGDFLDYYTDFTEKVVAPAAKQKSVKTEATIAQAAVSEIKPDSAVALLFVNQATTSQENPDGAFASSSIKVGLTKVDGAWMISSFDPV